MTFLETKYIRTIALAVDVFQKLDNFLIKENSFQKLKKRKQILRVSD